jgi:AcrR family transcriptional regulator
MKRSTPPAEGLPGAAGIGERRQRKKPGRPGLDQRQPYDLEMVIDAAVRLFNRHGYEASSMADLARATGLSKSSLYHYVASKEELLKRALDRAFAQLFAALDEPAARAGRPRDRLRHVILRATLVTLEFAREVELLQRIKGNTPVERKALKERQRVDRAVQNIVDEAVRAGELRADLEPGLVTKLIFGMSNSTTQWYRPGGRNSANEIARTVAAVLFEGLEPATRRS